MPKLTPRSNAMPESRRLSPTMLELVAYIRQHGAVERYPGGFWARPEWDGRTYSFGTNSVEALVTRKVAQYTAWKQGKNSRFPIRAELLEDSHA